MLKLKLLADIKERTGILMSEVFNEGLGFVNPMPCMFAKASVVNLGLAKFAKESRLDFFIYGIW